ncbi:hypothetical protein EVAR_35458_1 [Eumeta japonica]|uniref:Uncharacterized protein n=1 Tax=Eumeta variegata TaxID=151549 RepID=A0A4C1XPF5_EUMVA|nr:hypothetical protein EVAR_35458_1 [Eumeta japonica]
MSLRHFFDRTDKSRVRCLDESHRNTVSNPFVDAVESPPSVGTWRGSAALHARLSGRLVAAHVLCSAPEPPRLIASCAAFRVAGIAQNALMDVRSIPFNAGESVTSESTTQTQALSVLEALAIGVCVLMLVFVYAAGIVFYIHYKQKQRRKNKDPEMNRGSVHSNANSPNLDNGRMDMENVRMKTNPLLNLENLPSDFLLHDAGLSDVSERTEETLDSSPRNTQKFPNPNVITAMVHTKRKKPTRPSVRAPSISERMLQRMHRRSASPDTLERAPHSELAIVDCSADAVGAEIVHQQTGESVTRRKLYFNPVFFEIEHLKNPPPAAIDFLIKIREVMAIAKEKMTSKRFIPILANIPEEDLYHGIDLGWDIPCARRGRRFSAISLKRENSRRTAHCGGCPGCNTVNVKESRTMDLVRSNSCKTCVSEDYKQKIVRKWLDEVPSPSKSQRPIKSIAKVSGTPRIIEPKDKDGSQKSLSHSQINEEKLDKLPMIHKVVRKPESEKQAKSSIKRDEEIKIKEATVSMKDLKETEPTKISLKIDIKQPPSKVPPMNGSEKSPSLHNRSPSQHIQLLRKKLPPPPPPPIAQPDAPKTEEIKQIPPEIKMKMQAVIRELNQCRRAEPTLLEDVRTETVSPIAPKLVIPIVAADSHYYSDDSTLVDRRRRDAFRNREDCSSVNFDSNILKKRRFSVACGTELHQGILLPHNRELAVSNLSRNRLSISWRDIRKAVENTQTTDNAKLFMSDFESHSLPINEIFVDNTTEPIYNNLPKPGPLTIKVRGSPVERRRNVNDDFDPDTLDRKPKRDVKKRVDKILLKSAGSFKCKSVINNEDDINTALEAAFTKKIGSLRQIYEAKSKVNDDNLRYAFFDRRGSASYDSDDLVALARAMKAPDLIRQTESRKDPKPPVPPKQRRASDLSPKYINVARQSPPGEHRLRICPDDRDRFAMYGRSDSANGRRSGRRSTRTRSRRTDLRKLYRTEDSGYLSTDSNDSKRRARYMLQLRSRSGITEMPFMPPPLPAPRSSPAQLASDTDDLESLCDGHSESGAESVETDSVFFSNFDESKQLLEELGLKAFGLTKIPSEQIDSGFAGETNIILSGDSDSEHRSVISIVAGRDGRASSASITRMDEPPYVHSVEC